MLALISNATVEVEDLMPLGKGLAFLSRPADGALQVAQLRPLGLTSPSHHALSQRDLSTLPKQDSPRYMFTVRSIRDSTQDLNEATKAV